MKAFFRGVLVFLAVVIVTAIVLFAPLPLPPERVVLESASPDGLHVAKFSWRPAGVIGLAGDNPWVYVTIVSASSGAVVERHSTWGDVPGDACDRLGSLVPWHKEGASFNCAK